MTSRIKPLTGMVMIRLDRPDTVSATGLIALPAKRSYNAEAEQQANHRPTPPPAITGSVEAIGPWPIKNGRYHPPEFGLGAHVALRSGAGQDLRRFGTEFERLKMVRIRDVLAVVTMF